MNSEQKQRLDSIVAELDQIDGVDSAQSDDFDSHYVNIFLFLTPESDARGRCGPYKWKRPLRSIKAAVKRIVDARGLDLRFLDQPIKRRESNGSIGGKRLWFDLGYDGDSIKIEIPYV